MNNSTDLFLRPGEFARTLGLSQRQATRVLSEVEALGYYLIPDGAGVRRIQPELALAVKKARAAQHELLSLRLDPTLNKFLRRGRAAQPEPLEVLIEVAAEIGLVRGVAAALAEGARMALPSNWRAPDWAQLGLLDPRGTL